nr:diphthine--ammonia ligase [Leptinotarsa decemlineata]
MKVVALISGGKDSTFNMMQCIAAGHQIVALANLVPHNKTELDSFMYQSVGHEAIDSIAAAMDLPLYKRDTFGISNERGKIYKPSDNDEVEDLYLLLEQILKEIEIDAVSVGAILSDYQRVRVENVCIRLGLIPLAYLWQQNQKELLDEMIKCEVDAILIKVAALGLETKHLGRSLSLMQPHLLAMHEKYGLNICGEGGEYETLTLDCPLFKSRIVIKESKVVVHSNDPIAPVGYLVFEKLELELKLPALDLQGRLEGLPLKDSDGYVTNQGQGPFDITEDDIDDLQTSSGDASINSITYFPENIIQKALSIRSRNGWLWIGGIQGTSSDAYEAMNEAMSILKSELSLHNHSVKDICSVTMFVNDMSRYAALNELYVETFDFVNPPTRACVQVPFSQDCPLRMEVVSWKQPADSAGDEPIERQTMHVQSRSHWAPANIGPYSQTVRVRNFIQLAGQIGLVPGSMELVKGGIKAECRLGLRHLERLLKAVDSNFNLSNVVQGICYVSNVAFVEPARKLWEEKTNNAIVEYVVVTGLPKSAAVEWHVWAHKYNNQFDYEERGKCIEKYTISIYRRWNHENNVSAILCRIGHPEEDSPFNSEVFKEAMDYTIQKLRQDHEHDTTSVINLNIFYSVSKNMDSTLFSEYFENFTKDIQLSYTLVPVISLRNRQTFLSICGVRIP